MTIDELLETLLTIEGVEERKSRFSDRPALFVRAREIAHLESDGLVDIRLTAPVIRARRSEFRANPAIALRTSSSADWLEILVESASDEQLCIELVREAARANFSP
jgi:hypothetical protein